MSKIICDVCGTSFPDTATQCPICGCASVVEHAVANPEDKGDNAGHGSYTYVKGGRFSKTNVKKRNNGKKPIQEEPEEKPQKKVGKKKSNRGLIIAVIALFVAIVAVAVYIAVSAFILPGMKTTETIPATTAPTTVVTEPATEPEPELIPCEDLECPITVTLYEEGEVLQLQVKAMPEDTTDVPTYVILESSENANAITIDEAGNITAIEEGEAIVEVTCGEKKALCTVVCDFDAERPEDNEDDKSDDEKKDNDDKTASGEGSNHLLEDGTYKLNVAGNVPDMTLYMSGTHEMHLYDADGKEVDIEITSRGPNVCSVNGNVIRAVGYGYCTLVIRFGEGENDFFVCIVRVPNV